MDRLPGDDRQGLAHAGILSSRLHEGQGTWQKR